MTGTVLSAAITTLLAAVTATALGADVLIRLSESKVINTALVATDGQDVYYSSDESVYKLSSAGCSRVNFGDGRTPVTTVIAQTDADSIWLGTSEGLYLLNGRNAIGPRFPSEINELKVTTIAHKENSNSSDEFWVGTASGGLFQIQGSNSTPFCIDPSNASHCQGENVRALLWATTGRVWAGINAGIYYLDGSGSSMQPRILPGTEEFEVVDIFEAGNKIWFTTAERGRYSGGYRIDGNRLSKIFKDESLETALTVADIQNTAWIGTKTGLFRVATNSGTPERVYGVFEPVTFIRETGNSEIWVGTSAQLYYGTWSKIKNGPVMELSSTPLPSVPFAQSDLGFVGLLFYTEDSRNRAEEVWVFGDTGIYRIDRDNELVVSAPSWLFFTHKARFDIGYLRSIDGISRCHSEDQFFKLTAIDDPNFELSWPKEPRSSLSSGKDYLRVPGCCRKRIQVVARDSNTNVSQLVEENMITFLAYPAVNLLLLWIFFIFVLAWAAPYAERVRIVMGSERVLAKLFILNKIVLSFAPISRRFLLSMLSRHSDVFFDSLPGALLIELSRRKICCLVTHGANFDVSSFENSNWLGQDFLNAVVPREYRMSKILSKREDRRAVKRLSKAIPLHLDALRFPEAGDVERLVCRKIEEATGWEENVSGTLLRRGKFMIAFTNMDRITTKGIQDGVVDFILKYRNNHYFLLISETPIELITGEYCMAIQLEGKRWGKASPSGP